MNKISNFLSKISKKTKITILVITLIVLGITVLYQTFAISSNISGGSDNYTVTLNNNSTVSVPANGNKTVYFKIRNNNKGIVKYGVGYKGTNITVKVYDDSESPSTGTITESESKFIKLKLKNTSTSDSSVELISILGYENGGNLIVPNGYTLVTSIYTGPVNLVNHITKLYTNASKTTTTVNSVTYNLASSVGLMNDRKGSMSTNIDAGNIRYYGANPNNYIYFNCSDYSNQTSSTCETWRIIGVFDGKVKIMRNEIIGSIPYDNDDEDTYLQSISADNNKSSLVIPLIYDNYDGSTIMQLAIAEPTIGAGQNDYSKSSLQKILNNYYYNSLKYTGKYTYDFTSAGFKNDTTRNMIAEITYNLGGHDSTSIYSNQIYSYERGTTVPSGNATTWTGKIAVAYPSDYGYAADLSLCQKQLGSYNDATCTANNWMKSILAPNYGWLLTPSSGTASIAWAVGSPGNVYVNGGAYNARGVAPVLSLISELDIGPGSGTSSSPYQLSV